MSTNAARETRAEDAEEVSVACETSLIDGEWETKAAAVYPPGYPRLCSAEECFGECVPEEAWNSDGTAEWDHTEEVETLVRSSQHGHSRRFHRPEHG